MTRAPTMIAGVALSQPPVLERYRPVWTPLLNPSEVNLFEIQHDAGTLSVRPTS